MVHITSRILTVAAQLVFLQAIFLVVSRPNVSKPHPRIRNILYFSSSCYCVLVLFQLSSFPALVPTIPPDMQIVDNTECNFNVNSFKMVYVVNSESYLYKRTALTKAKQVLVVGSSSH